MYVLTVCDRISAVFHNALKKNTRIKMTVYSVTLYKCIHLFGVDSMTLAARNASYTQ